jgi:hypothetical protein
VGDQRGNFPGHLFPLAPLAQPQATEVRLSAPPVPIVLDPALPAGYLDRFRLKSNPDYEDLTCDPYRTDTSIAVIEMDAPCLVELTWRPGDARALLRRMALVDLGSLQPWRGNLNYRLEGVAVVGPGPELVLAYERAADELPRLLRATWRPDDPAAEIKTVEIPLSFAAVPPRAGKGLLNINAVAVCPHPAPYLLLLARDQERILVVDGAAIVRIIDLDLRDPTGQRIHWTSPEGIAVDAAGGRVFIVADPDSEQGNYRRLEDVEAADNYALYVPLLFTVPLSAVLPAAAAPDPGR